MELTIDQALKEGVAAQKEGKLQDAERLYRAILQSQPGHPDANHNLGVIASSAGKSDDALRLFKAALESNPRIEQFWLSYVAALVRADQFKLAKQAIKKAKRYRISGKKLKPLLSRSKIIAGREAPPREQLEALLEHYQSGRFAEAEQVARLVIKNFPANRLSWNLLGSILGQAGRFSEAINANKEAVTLFPEDPQAHYNLGITLKEMGRLTESEASFKQALVLKPDYARAHNNLSVTLQELGKLEAAEASCKQAISIEKGFAEAHYNLGITLRSLGKLDESEASFKMAIALKPEYAAAYSNLGNILLGLGKLQEAEESCKRAIAITPGLAEAHVNLGNTLEDLGRWKEAEASFQQAIALRFDFAEAHFHLGNTRQQLESLEAAVASYQQAITLKPDFIDAHVNLGNVLQKLGRFEMAESTYKQVLALKPDFAEGYNNLGNALQKLGKFEEAESSYKKAISLKPNYPGAYSNLLFLNASMRFDASRYLEYVQYFADMVARQSISGFNDWSSSEPSGGLRVGFVSGDFKAHPVGFFLEGVLTELQSSDIELYAYTTTAFSDKVTHRMRSLFKSWVSLSGKSDEDAAHLIHNDGVNILVDLSGHTAKNRLPVFGWKPAPIQISWLGYFGSTGLPEIDYILGDPFVTPESEAHHFTEKIWQLPESYLCFTQPDEDLAVSPLPALSNGFVTFGCFNSLSRMSDEVTSTRADILHAVPGSKLFLKDARLEGQSGRKQILSRFASFDIGPDRLILEGRSNRDEYLASYHRVDIALSPFPYGGGTTSVEGLWMGVPVVTKKGNYFLSHIGESIAHNSNLSDWIAEDNEDYIVKAIEFSSDLSALERLRQSLRQKLLSAPLYDLPRFAKHFEQALWDMRSSNNR